jgi:CheY-like chemotaxis protein
MNNNVIHVLLVEDDQINQMIVGAFLRRWGVQVTIANNGREAVLLILEKNFQIVLMDLQMPCMDGYEATSIIRAMDDLYFKTVPIIAFTASILSHVKKKAFQIGITDLLSKPFEVEELNRKIQEYSNALPKTQLPLISIEDVNPILNVRP